MVWGVWYGWDEEVVVLEGGVCKSVDVRYFWGCGVVIDIGLYWVVIGNVFVVRVVIVWVNSVDDDGLVGWKGVVVYREVIGFEEEVGEYRCNGIVLFVG